MSTVRIGEGARGVLRIVLPRPERAKALDLEVGRGLEAVLSRIGPATRRVPAQVRLRLDAAGGGIGCERGNPFILRRRS